MIKQLLNNLINIFCLLFKEKLANYLTPLRKKSLSNYFNNPFKNFIEAGKNIFLFSEGHNFIFYLVKYTEVL